MPKSKNKYIQNNTYLIFLGAGISQKYCIEKAYKMGLKIILVDGKLDINEYKYCDVLLKIDFVKKEKNVLNWIKKNNIKLSGAMSYCNEAGMKLAAKLRLKYKLPGMGIEITEKMSNKILQRKLWDKAKLSCPNWVTVKHSKKYKNVNIISKRLKFPLIIKPADSAGSRGVTKIESKNQIIKNIDKAMKISNIKHVIIEEYIEGIEYTIESFTNNSKTIILAVTKKYKIPGTNKTVANQLESLDNKNFLFKHLGNLTIEALKALKFENGPAHTEIIYNHISGEEIIVETAGRGGGFKILDSLVPAITGFDATKASILQAINKQIRIPKLSNNYAILKWLPSRKGTVRSISGFNKVRRNENKNINIEGNNFVDIGAKVNTPTCDGDRLGYLLCWGKNKSEVKEILKKSHKQIKFKIN